jgi:hypothetical protein
MNKINKIKQFFSKELSKDLQNVLLLEVSGGSYLVFGKYSIVPKGECYEIRTIKEPWRNNPILTDLRIAIAWCIYDKCYMSPEARRLPEIDTELSGIKISLAALQQKFNKSSSLDDKCIYLAKIQETKYKKSRILRELNYYIGTTMLWQKEKFRQFDPTYS